ncbi:MAG TPA: hypothetical protein VFV37_07460 [Luteibaculaceae bacterium]|nr:hypothetical protein [Luteibaculaceae bacterium]
MKKIILIFSLLSGIHAIGQDSTQAFTALSRFSVAGAPIDFLIGRYRIDVDFQLGGKIEKWLSISPVWYSYQTKLFVEARNRNRGFDPGDSVRGAGINLQLKFVENRIAPNLKLYLALGVGYHALTYRFSDYNFEAFKQDGLEYFEYRLGDQFERIRRVETFVAGGFRYFFNKRVFLDTQVGIKYNSPSISGSLYIPRRHDFSVYDQGYKGLSPRAMLTFGYAIW